MTKIFLHSRHGYIGQMVTAVPDETLATLKNRACVMQVEDNRKDGWIAVHFL